MDSGQPAGTSSVTDRDRCAQETALPVSACMRLLLAGPADRRGRRFPAANWFCAKARRRQTKRAFMTETSWFRDGNSAPGRVHSQYVYHWRQRVRLLGRVVSQATVDFLEHRLLLKACSRSARSAEPRVWTSVLTSGLSLASRSGMMQLQRRSVASVPRDSAPVRYSLHRLCASSIAPNGHPASRQR